MGKITWKPFPGRALDGTPYIDEADTFNLDKTLLDRILDMPVGEPIGIHEAYDLFWSAVMFEMLETGVGGGNRAAKLHDQDWVVWVSKQGFQIKLTGSEYEIKEAA